MSNDTTKDDFDLFRQTVAEVEPIKKTNKVSLKKQAGAIQKRKQTKTLLIKDTLSDDFIPDCGEFLEFKRAGIQNAKLKLMRNGRLPIENRLDLHGHTRDAARTELLQFIMQSQMQGCSLLCIVHGKGYHSENGRPVLKAMVNKWLQDIPQVLAFVTAQPKDGGSGAVYVLLKRHTETT